MSAPNPKESKFTRYRDYTSKLIPWLKNEIDNRKIVDLKVEDVLDKMGPVFTRDVNVYKYKKDLHIRVLWELKILFWLDEIVVNGARKGVDDYLIFRKVTSDDEPPSFELTQDIEDAFYVKDIFVEIVSEDPFSNSDDDIRNKIDILDIPDGAISVIRIGNWKKAPYK